ncbi:MAG: glycosyltransferase family 4 protein [Bacteroides sp.]|nr:glycosyltransferase family 4 protein [Bacteroides sp.]MCM1413260.1 glycosyltransferase family 4 protein [Bacteroides sp.]MCM1471430.1 glycosyltransferase family 4 protein [Bacteroides sp.]
MHRIALITYDISPYRGSEASVSWNFVVNMSPHVHLTVIYGRHKEEVDKFLSNNSLPNVEWINIPVEENNYNGIRGTMRYMSNYRRWQRKAYKILSQKSEDGEIDLIHYLNPIGFKEPGYSWKIPGIPYVWGPIMCVENRPTSLFRVYSLKNRILAYGRRIVHNSLFRFIPRVNAAFKAADTIFCATPNGKRLLKKVHHRDAEYLPENGIVKMDRTTPVSLSANEPLQLIWVGRVSDESKAIEIMLDALAKTHSRQWHLHVVGEGDIKPGARSRISGLLQNITFHGRIPREQVYDLFNKAHLHVITSLGEGNPTTIWEAMSQAVPTLTLDHCGMAGVVCNNCGIKIPLDSYANVTSNIASHIDEICENPSIINRLSKGVIDCSKKFMWHNRIGIFLETYHNLINANGVSGKQA